jgi:predicted CXXCH cytochrome family protein
MKRWITVLVLGAAVLFSGQVSAQKSAMLNGKHDVRATGNTGDACGACHTPHGANTSYKAVLWNRSYVPTAATFTSYDATTNPDFKGGAVSLGSSSALSLLCMSCHDGTSALNAVINTPAGTVYRTGTATAATNLGTDLTNDHPVGFSYDASITGQGTPAKLIQTPDPTKVKLFGAAGSRRVECGSCHDAHSTAAGFLRSPNTNSSLCLACHI